MVSDRFQMGADDGFSLDGLRQRPFNMGGNLMSLFDWHLVGEQKIYVNIECSSNVPGIS